jgi:hypothetical protein
MNCTCGALWGNSIHEGESLQIMTRKHQFMQSKIANHQIKSWTHHLGENSK